MKFLEGNIGPNVEAIRAEATRVIRGRIPAAVRRELMDSVKAGRLGRLRRDGLKPEVFYHPDHLHGARERQNREAEYAATCIAGVVLAGAEKASAHFAMLTHERHDEAQDAATRTDCITEQTQKSHQP